MANSNGWRAAALARACAALLILSLFVLAYLSSSDFNELLNALVGSQFSTNLYDRGFFSVFVVFYAIISLLAGRVYCSVLCPMGTLQELFWRAGVLFKTKILKSGAKAGRAGYVKTRRIRYLVPLLVGLGLVFSIPPLMILADPISNFGRGMGAIYFTFVERKIAPLAIALALPFALILIVSLLRGRRFCDWCPVGVTLGLLSSIAPLGMKVSEGCLSCGLCEKKCPAGCVNSREKKLDSERCLLCFSCAAVCPGGFVAYGASGAGKSEPRARRAFLKRASGRAAVFLFGAAYLGGANLKFLTNGGGDDVSFGIGPEADPQNVKFPILPPGAKDARHYISRCVACQACAKACPVKILKPKDFPQPTMDYSSDFCQYNCAECVKVCPTHALYLRDIDEKRRTRLALSNLTLSRCVVVTKSQACGACAEVCPTRSLRMVPYADAGLPGLTIPVFDEPYCIGCGACSVVCPAEPIAFNIDGVPRQTLTPGIRPTEDDDGDVPQLPGLDDFPF
jgi:ferredoxin-type protein NapF